ncbi:MAG: sporulation protein YqfD [Clostridia bacterium]|nr:sporulation protein YqfD [Clostridia bacterium]
MIGKFIDYLIGKGYFEISVTGNKDVQILNLLKDRGFFDCRVTGEKIHLSCSGSDIKRISELLDGHGVEYKYSAEGIFWLAKRVLLRRGAIAGAVLCIAMHSFFSNMIWEIDIIGNSTVPEGEIRRTLEGLGVYEGCLKDSINVKKLYLDYMTADDRISFAHLNMDGTTGVFEVAERKQPPEKEPDKKEVCNIVARCDGIIYRADVYSGGCEVSAGESVVKGQLLISSFFESRVSGHLLRRAKGTVFAHTEPCFEMMIPKKRAVRGESRICEKRYLKLLENTVAIDGLLPQKTSGQYERRVDEQSLKLFGIVESPVKYVKASYTAFDTKTEFVGKEQAQLMYKKAFEEWKSGFSKNAEIVSEKTETEETDEYFRFFTKLSCIENIALEKPFKISET